MTKREDNLLDKTPLDFYQQVSTDLLAKCRSFESFLEVFEQDGVYHSLYRLPLTGSLDHRIKVRNPKSGKEMEMICYDSNSYLGLHLHPRVINATKRALDQMGYGTPSAQLLGGTNECLIELEKTISEFHGREAAIIFPSGYSANIGVLNALLRKSDVVAVDRFCHGSIHDGVPSNLYNHRLIYPHRDTDTLDHLLATRSNGDKTGGKLIATDGVFSMHGTLAPLPELRKVASEHNATLLVDDAHATGILGPDGTGIESHFGMKNAADILVGTFSKVPGTTGGYVCGEKALISYLRHFANSGMLTASLPAATCAGVTEAYRVMQEEPEHRYKLKENVGKLDHSLRQAGLNIPYKTESPILTVFMGTSRLLRRFSLELFRNQIKCGSVDYPAVPRGKAAIRISVTSRHTDKDINQTVSVFHKLGQKFDILNRTQQEIYEIGKSCK